MSSSKAVADWYLRSRSFSRALSAMVSTSPRSRLSTVEGLVGAYGQDALDTLGEYLERDLDDVIEHITLHGKYASYYMDYRFDRTHLSHLNLLKGILHLINLQSRMNNLLDQVVQGHVAA